MVYNVIETDTYEKEVDKWDKSEKDVAEKIPKQLKYNPYSGDQVSYPFLREKRIDNKRVYYLIYDDLKLVLLVATSSKKDQQRVIDFIKNNLSRWRTLAEGVSKQPS